MLQKFINNTFYLLFLFTLVFGVVFYDTTKFLSFIDELCAVSLCFLYAYYIFHTPNWSINKLFLITLGVFFFYLFYSFYIHSNVKSAIISDFIIQIKPYLAFFTVYAFAPKFNDQMRKNIRLLAIVFSFYLFGIGIISLFDDTILEILLHHRSRLATASTIMALLYLFCSDYTTKDKIIFIALLSICLLSSRSKAYGFFTIAVFFIFYLNKNFKLEFNWKNIGLGAILLTLTIIIAWDKIHLYFIQGGFGDGRETSDLYARMALYYFSTEVYMDYFPFGSGFATYATFTSGQYYSPLYNQYGMDTLYGLTEYEPKFIADTYYPALAQFGIIGTILFFLFWIHLTQKTLKLFNTNNLKYFIISLLIIIFFLIECTSDATLTHNRGLFMMMLLALSIREMKKTINLQQKSHENHYSK